jgi:hypothetical protein
MAVSATDISGFTKWPIGNGLWGFYFKYTGPSSYTASGEVLSKTVCKAAMEGLSEIYSMDTPLAMPVGGATCAQVGFEPTNTSTNTGTFHFFNSVNAHTHSFLVKGGTAAAGTDAINIKATVIGKEAVTDATNTGTTNGGVQNSTAGITSTEAAASGAYNTYICYCRGIGRM